ncbi:UNVERIFIED_CONTAM: hypothetical protein HDU68_000613 [Siphonaria sp. JEL0065]|nr:hypothetical protein HDU68_000613 [Siphonaria sp. JEL0065]
MVHNLKSIDLSNTYMDDGAFRFLVRNSPGLEELVLSQCPRVTDEGIAGICSFMAPRVKVLKMAACFAVSKDGFRKGLSELALRATNLKYLDISSNSGNIDHEIMLEFATLRNTKAQAEIFDCNDKSKPTQTKKKLVVDITGDGWEFTKDEVDSIELRDLTLKLIHNAKMANHSEEGVKEYLEYLMSAY